MELRHLRYFIAVAECRGFVRASASLRIAQPALSRQIRDLEQELGVPLFERSRRGALLTFPGECFLQDARRILDYLEQAQSRARRVHGGYAGVLSIGMVESFTWHEAITHALRRFQSQWPDVALNVALMSSPEQLVAIREGQISSGFLFNRPPEDDMLDGIQVLTTEAVLAVPESSPYATHPPHRLMELQDQDFVFIPRALNPPYYDKIIHACHSAGLTPRIVQSGTNDSSNLSLVAAELGLTIVPAAAESRKPKNVVLVPVGDLNVVTTMELVWRRDNQSSALKNFVAVLRESAG
ncbi:MAG: LysR substrate-binding domain-containing protein [Candidatus Korobacteraceae bacterium]|jgi:DNA-binding transcriptional LysR family regulator